MSAIVFELPIKTVSEANQRGIHWAKTKRFANQRAVVKARLWAHVAEERAALEHGYARVAFVVTLTRISPGTLDREDNLPSAFKAIKDSVAECLGIDDRDPRVEWRYAQEKRTRSRKTAALPPYAVRIEIEAAT